MTTASRPNNRRLTRAELESFRGAAVPDLLPPEQGARSSRPAEQGAGSTELRLLFVGINPGLWTAATQTHFAHPGNRFYPALLEAGIVTRRIDPSAGMTDDDREHLLERGIGITNLSPRATARADELSAAELREGAERLRVTVARARPRVVAVAGITAYRTAFGRRGAAVGEQPERFEGARLWVVPNPSGLNARETIASLAVAYAEPARAAGVI
ncbi:MAG TPA: mismatch-specific DNA-glycosylase [Ornithinicoccus sp.]|nr:mismatch-specific DNA-glycosylase [Ornithinicoccus sp.]